MIITLGIMTLISCGETEKNEEEEVVVVEIGNKVQVSKEIIQLGGDTVKIITYHSNFKINFQGKVVVIDGEDVKEGVWTTTYPSGKTWSLNTFIGGLKDGTYKTWHPNGQLNISGNYTLGVASGHWQFMDSTGSVTREFHTTQQ